MSPISPPPLEIKQILSDRLTVIASRLMNGGTWAVQEAYKLQVRCFLGLVHEQRHLPNLKALLKLYSTISLPKLSVLLEMDETSLRGELMLLKVLRSLSVSCLGLFFVVCFFLGVGCCAPPSCLQMKYEREGGRTGEREGGRTGEKEGGRTGERIARREERKEAEVVQ